MSELQLRRGCPQQNTFPLGCHLFMKINANFNLWPSVYVMFHRTWFLSCQVLIHIFLSSSDIRSGARDQIFPVFTHNVL